MKHSPGPWRAEGENVFTDVEQIFSHAKNFSLINPSQTLEANAKLIAASPKMLKALEYARDNHHEGEGEYDKTLKDAINEAIG